ncbi:hypothetical protein [Leptospira ainazelensis]|uniref:hypothetical protein n=1 Tax=Leptospira ainazelensis TaxID=2810034 RepID=UPI0019648C4B|nr:hypothetical protein [Leptospira ainazelensis]
MSQIAVLLLFAGFNTNAGSPEIKKRSIENQIKTAPQNPTNGFFSANEDVLRIVRTQSNNDSRSEKRNCVFCHSGSEKI